MPNNRSIIKNEKTNYKTNLILQTINTPSANLATIVNNHTSLKMENRLDLHDSCCKPDKIESITPPLISVVNIISVPLKICRPKQKNKYKSMVCIDVDDDLYIFKNYGKALKRTPSWKLRARSNLIPWNSFLFQ